MSNISNKSKKVTKSLYIEQKINYFKFIIYLLLVRVLILNNLYNEKYCHY